MSYTTSAVTSGGTENLRIALTIQELTAATARLELVLPSEVEAVYATLCQVPEFGLKVAMALQAAAKAAAEGKAPRERVLDAAIVPAFLAGMLVGLEQAAQAGLGPLASGSLDKR